MAKKIHLKFEYMIVIFVLFAVVLFLIPFSTGNTRQATYISKWNEIFNKVEYMFSVMNAHVDDDMLKSLKKAQSTKEKEKILLAIVKPYLRIDTNNIPPKRYSPRYKNGSRVLKNEKYYFDDFYYAKSKTVVGIKNVNTREDNDPFFMMMFDVNGILLPNRWGIDIYGINIYDKGRIEPFGFDETLDALHADCSSGGTGIGCSYYYKIGGEF